MRLRKVKPEEKYIALEIIEMAKLHLKNQGIDQWQDGYPNLESIKADITAERGYFIVCSDEPVGYMCLDFDGEPVYGQLDGNWKHDGKYAALHRLAISDKGRGKGYGKRAFELAEEYCKRQGINSIRVDTKNTNPKMRHVITSNGYQYRGDVYYESSGARMAFEKVF